MDAHYYRICDYAQGPAKQEIVALRQHEEAPDITRCDFSPDIWRVAVQFHEPLEYALCNEIRFDCGAEFMATYYPNGKILTHRDLKKMVDENEMNTEVFWDLQARAQKEHEDLRQLDVYDTPFDVNETLYVSLLEGNLVDVLRANAAVLTRLPQPNTRGQIWHKTSPLLYRLGLAPQQWKMQ